MTFAVQEYREELDCRFDKHERVVKLSRDCTIQSKRIIFHLHRQPAGSDELLSEARDKLDGVVGLLRKIAMELSEEDPAYFHRAYTPGIQEFIEALSYYQFVKEQRLVSFEEIQMQLTFRAAHSPCTAKAVLDTSEKADFHCKGEEDSSMEWSSSQQSSMIVFPLAKVDYVLGVADLTGELMRLCVNVASSEDSHVVFRILHFVGSIYTGFLSLLPIHKEIPKKIHTLHSSLVKIEKVCYMLTVRGSEVPRHMLVDIANSATQQDCAELLDS